MSEPLSLGDIAPVKYLFMLPLLRWLNHVLHQAGWPVAELRHFSGQTIHLTFGQMRLAVMISAMGDLQVAQNPVASPQVSIFLPADAPVKVLTKRAGREALFASAHVTGAADLAEVLARIGRHLSWDIEADLASCLGDMLAHRLARGGRALMVSTQDGLQRFFANLSEYLQVETETLPNAQRVQHFCSEVDQLRDRLARLEARMRYLQHTTTPLSLAP